MEALNYSSTSSELKRSCEECSSSKVKCSQDRPACKRCQKQKVSCTYAPAKRTGRPRKVRKDNGPFQPRIIRPLASAASREANHDLPSAEMGSSLPEYSIEQSIYSYSRDELDLDRRVGVRGAGSTAGISDVAHVPTPCHLLDHDWPTTALDLEALWGTPLHQQPYADSAFDGYEPEFGSCGLMEEGFGW
ncbi:fungal zn(2)-Cys(6) binuclear cluster domain-containing protein [Cordyceps javanica]|nr:fungal zn(2)-Cys(6) binuclear cluster domain-containing protein [Cordyceps javanica]